MMTKAIVMKKPGGPEVLQYEAVDVSEPGAGEVLIRHEAIGLNFIDVYHRTGLYPLPSYPVTPGVEGAGVVEKLGDQVTDLAVGDRVAYAGGSPGAYAQKRVMPVGRLVKLPDEIDFKTAAGMMLQGMTARYLLRGCYPVKKGDTVLIHAAAGGVGSIVVQWASHIGARVIGTVGSKEKAARVEKLGCRHPVLYREENFVEAVRRITGGRGVDVVYDSVGKDTLLDSMKALRPMGTLVSFGQSSGAVESFNPGLLAQNGSLFLTRPSLFHYTAKREDLLAHAEDLFDAVKKRAVAIDVTQEFPLADAAGAHEALEGRRTTGAVVLVP